MKSRITLLLTLNLTLAAIAFAAEPSATPSPQPTSSPQAAKNSLPEIQAIAQLDKDYEAAYSRGDANPVAAFYTNDAEYVDEGGNVLSGRDTIEKLLAEEFTQGHKTNPIVMQLVVPAGLMPSPRKSRAELLSGLLASSRRSNLLYAND